MFTKDNEFLFTASERFELVVLSKAVADAWPEAFVAKSTLGCLRRLVFSKIVGEIMDGFLAAGQEAVKYDLAGTMFEILNRRVSKQKILTRPCALILASKRAAAVSLLCMAVVDECNENMSNGFLAYVRVKVGEETYAASLPIFECIRAWE